MKPLNGTKTHPLTAHALKQLDLLCNAPRPTQEINAGVIDRFLREGLIVVVERPSPYATHKGRSINFAQITPAGMLALAAAKEGMP